MLRKNQLRGNNSKIMLNCTRFKAKICFSFEAEFFVKKMPNYDLAPYNIDVCTVLRFFFFTLKKFFLITNPVVFVMFFDEKFAF